MDRGGAETLIMNVYRAIDRSRTQFDFLVHEQRECDYDSEIESYGGKIYRIQRFLGPNLVSYVRKCRKFFEAHHNYCAVHVHIGSCAPIVITQAHRYGLFVIAHSHRTDAPLSFSSCLYKLATFPIRFLADYFLACSEQAGVDGFGKRVAGSDSFRVFRNGIDTDQYLFNLELRNELRAELGVDDSTIVLCHIGRFATEKNHKFLIDIFSNWLQVAPQSVLVLVGRGPLELDTRQKVESLGIGDKVHFLGIRSDVPSILMAADLFLFPSIYEGFGIAAVEAQATGLPCVISDTVPEIASLLPTTIQMSIDESPCVWSKAGIKLLNMRQCYDRRNCSRRVRELGFDINDIAQELISLYVTHQMMAE